MKYRHLFFDLDHTLWDFNANARLTLRELYENLSLQALGVHDFDLFHINYLEHNERLWARYRNGFIKVDELRWKRMWHTLLDFKIGNEKLARELGNRFVELLPGRNLLFPDTIEVLQYLTDKGYKLHLITNGFESTQHQKLKNAGLDRFFIEVVTSEGSNSLKPQKEIFEYALRKCEACQRESIMLGDTPEVDILGAINAGIDQVFVNHLQLEQEIKATYEVKSLIELKEIF